MQVFRSSETCCSTLFNVIPCYTKIFALFFGYLLDFLYLCSINQNIKAMSQKSNPSTILSGASPASSTSSASLSGRPSSPLGRSGEVTLLSARPSSPSGRSGGVYGRTELATRYFPYIQPQTAWQKLRSLLASDPALAHLAALRRRTFLPAEVNIIYQHLGQP